MTFKKAATVDPKILAGGIDRSGFGVGEMQIVARGTYDEKDGKPALKVTGSGQLFLVTDGQLLEKLKAARGEVAVTGRVDLDAPQPPYTIIVMEVRP